VTSPPPGVGEPLRIVDRYLDGTTLRLRQVGDDRSAVFKLGQKIRAVADDPFLVWMTTLYLSAAEHRRLSVLPAAVLVKSRRRVRHEGTWYAVDEFAGALQGLVLAETELAETELAGGTTALPGGLPTWLGREVTSDDRYSGATLARRGLPAGWQPGG